MTFLDDGVIVRRVVHDFEVRRLVRMSGGDFPQLDVELAKHSRELDALLVDALSQRLFAPAVVIERGAPTIRLNPIGDEGMRVFEASRKPIGGM